MWIADSCVSNLEVRGYTNDACVSIHASKKQTDEDHRPMADGADRIRNRADSCLGGLADLVYIAPAAIGVSR